MNKKVCNILIYRQLSVIMWRWHILALSGSHWPQMLAKWAKSWGFRWDFLTYVSASRNPTFLSLRKAIPRFTELMRLNPLVFFHSLVRLVGYSYPTIQPTLSCTWGLVAGRLMNARVDTCLGQCIDRRQKSAWSFHLQAALLVVSFLPWQIWPGSGGPEWPTGSF